ncbi:callose synthase 11 [Silene latifolia]|uniref:callose synthase 11 n=1 Tax=Silene latifolia TaxID=37657 RepID=UPI003D787ABB
MNNLRQRATPSRFSPHPHAPPPQQPTHQPFNIIPIHDLLIDHPSTRYPEVRAAASALRAVDDLRKPPFHTWHDTYDLLDWLGLFFGFQRDNVRNTREHLVLHLANAQMRLYPPPQNPSVLDFTLLRKFRKKLLSNYTSWCSFLGKRHAVKSHLTRRNTDELRREMLYVSLYLLVWGEAANLRFMPECICYIFHHLCYELNYVIEDHPDRETGRPYVPTTIGENSFLNTVVRPLYDVVKDEVGVSKGGSKPHSAWRNYDDLNEYFWTRRCFKSLKWPLDLTSAYFTTGRKRGRVGKTGFVEQRSFWNVFRSFDRVWILLILMLQAMVIVAAEGTRDPWKPWQAVEKRDVQVKLLTVFITWAGLRLVQSILDAGMQYSLVGRETWWLAVRMVLKSMVAIAWIVVFSVFYARIWIHKDRHDRGRWLTDANDQILVFLKAVFVFVIPELLSIVLFIIPWVRNFIEEANFPLIYWLTWWFHTRIFVGRSVREGLINNVKYSFFWILVLVSKFAFSYFLQIKPLIEPTRALMKLKNVSYNWHEFFNNTNRIAVVLLWLPVIVIYLVDLQIWYSVYSSVVGAYVGLFSHLGEIRSIWQLRLRFQFFASAMQFNLMPEEQLPTVPVMTLVNKLRDAVQRIRLRYGLGKAYNKIESSQVEATRFALLWNEIMVSMREEDLLSDREVELLELPPNCWEIRVVRWPCVLLCNELLLSVSQAGETDTASDRWLLSKISKSEYRRCAIIEAYDSVKYLLLHHVIKYGSEEHSIVTRLFLEMDHYMSTGEFTANYKLKSLPQIHAKLVALAELLLSAEKDTDGVINVLQALYELRVRELPSKKKTVATLREEGLALQNPGKDSGFLFENAVEFPAEEDVFFYRQLRRLYTILTSRDSMHSVPTNIEARRRIAFFSNSLFMNMPRAPQVEKMMAFTVLTPYYDEDVIYGSSKLQSPNEDGISILFYLQKIYEDEWKNFMERMRREGLEDEREIWTIKARDLRLWASYRGQTLSRTVRGMMYYYRALKMLSFLDSASEMDIRAGCQQIASYGSLTQSNNWESLGSMRATSSRNLSRAVSGVSLLYKGHEFGNAMMKFTYVVACQVYGIHKIAGDSRAEEILYLMKNNEALRVAYVDEVHRGREEVEYYSVLVKYDQQLQREVEIYRVQLPGPIKLGEGKPENQNHALIFTRGDALQTIDMNQDNYFEEALKIRNLLDEFNKYYGIRRPTILGVRENIFTGSVSSLAWFMSAQETSFVTLGQRVLANPLKVRMHYGHPDVFDRFWFLARGGISKASKLINLSEDIFAGFNCTLRGGNVTHHEYIQVGKGRDVGLNQIAMFEAKVASGNGEQLLSRDVYRLGHRLDFFRMLSVFYTTVGFYFNTMMVVLSVYTFLWGRLYLALSGVEKAAMKNSSNNAALGAIVNQQFVIQIGMFTALPMIVENSLEHGFLPAVWDFLKMQLQLASLFYTFSLGTRCHYFGRTILHGGAKYRATGRGFVVEHKKFAENYRLYSRSHFVKAIELGVILVVYASHSPLAKGTFVYIAMSISSWFLVVSWIMAPFVFNPSGFDWLKAVYDFEDFITWIWYGSGVSTKADRSWETWWYEEQEHLKTTGLWGKLLEIILDLRFFFFQYGIVYHLKIASGRKSIAVYLLSWVSFFVLVGIYVIIAYARDRYAAAKHIYYRVIQFSVISVTVLVTIIMLKFTDLVVLDLLTSLLAFIPTGWGIILIAQVLRPFLQTTLLWETVVSLARIYDLLFGIIVMTPMALLSWMPGFQSMQTRILFNDAFSRGLEISQLLTAK